MISILGLFSSIREECVSIIRSGLVIQIMISLSDGSKTLSDLREITGSKSQTIIPILRKLEMKGYIDNSRYIYFLTPIGRLIYLKIHEYFITLASIENNREFWDKHYIDTIPLKNLTEIGDLVNMKMVKSTSTDFFSLYHDAIRMISEAKRLYIMTSVYGLEYQKDIIDNVVKKIPVEAIITPEIGELLNREIENKWTFLDNISTLQVDMWITPETMKFVMLISDSSIYLFLFFKNGENLDIATALFGDDQKSIAWGERLFNHYKSGAKKIEF